MAKKVTTREHFLLLSNMLLMMFVGASAAFMLNDITSPVASKLALFGYDGRANFVRCLPLVIIFIAVVFAFIPPCNKAKFSFLRTIGCVPIWLRLIVLAIFLFLPGGLAPEFDNVQVDVIMIESKPNLSIVEQIDREAPCKLIWSAGGIMFDNNPKTNKQAIRTVLEEYKVKLKN